MGIKRFAALFVCFAIIFAPFTVFASGISELSLERAQILMPSMDVYYIPEDGSSLSPDSVTATLNGVPLEVVGEEALRDTAEGTCYLFVVDCSTSISYVQMEEIKKSLHIFTEELHPDDSMALFSFGETFSVLLEGDAPRDEAAGAIDSLRNNQQSTTLFDAVNKTIDYAETAPGLPARKVLVLFSDAEELSVGSYTYDELADRLTGAPMPVYAVGLDNGSRDSLDALGVLARNSGGEIRVASPSGIGETLAAMTARIATARKLSLSAPTNQVSRQQETLSLSIQADGVTVEREMLVVPHRWVPDNEPPSITEIRLTGGNAIIIRFQEPVINAGVASNFIVTRTEGSVATVQQATYSATEQTTILTMAEDLEPGDYTVVCKNITDLSMEANIIANSGGFSVAEPPPPPPEPKDNTWIAVSIGVLVVGAVVSVAVVIGRTQNAKQQTAAEVVPMHVAPSVPAPAGPEPRHNFQARSASTLCMNVTDYNNITHKVEVMVDGSIFIGSSSLCNLSFEDSRMAAQHFVIEARPDGFYIQDLETPGGTFVNGVRVGNPRRLAERDTITAGQETFVLLGN